MEARLSLHRYKTALMFNALFLAALLGGNAIAQSFGWMPCSELTRSMRTRASRAGRKLITLFDK
jgi:hypothetical protein